MTEFQRNPTTKDVGTYISTYLPLTSIYKFIKSVPKVCLSILSDPYRTSTKKAKEETETNSSERDPTTKMVTAAGSYFLPEDILILIFTFLPVTSIYKFRTLSKAWLSILSDPNFITTWCPINSTSKSLQWIHYAHYSDSAKYFKLKSACPSLYSNLISTYDHGLSFDFLRNSKPYDEIHVLGSSHGLVLCNTYSTTDRDLKWRYYVCNPLTQKSVLIPPPPRGYPRVTGFSCEYASDNTIWYKVLCMNKGSSADIYCSKLGRWERFLVSGPVDIFPASSSHNVVASNGVLYWINLKHNIIACNLNNLGTVGLQCSCISLPDECGATYLDRILGVSEGLICYASITRSQITLSVWVLKGDNWQLLYDGIELQDIFLAMELRKKNPSSTVISAERVQVVGFHPADHYVVLLRCWNCIWEFNIRTRTFEELFSLSVYCHAGDFRSVSSPFVLKPMPTILHPFVDRHLSRSLRLS